ncbi:MAG: hypothetical protein KME26_31650 [Oscillatoria princeps RMCB-10]|nr:hypothetical protein [Oscillatoria princeps RMCB-10]
MDTASPHSTLLDGQTPGKVLFSLAGDEAEFTPGLVRYNGSRVSIDLTGLQEIPTGFLLLRIINGDTDTGSAISVKNLTDTTDPEGVASPIFPVQEKKATIGPALNIGNLTQTQALQVNLSDVRLNSSAGLYTASLQVVNNGPAASRNVAVSFANLPAGVQLQNASGVDAAGFPYINLRNAIQPGGLDAGETSAPVEVIFINPNFSAVPVITEVFVGEPNTAPNFSPVGALTVKPGERLEIPLSATDANGDRVIYSIRSDSRLPKGKITGNGQLLLTPAPDDVGTYNFTLVASDGALETPQEVTLTVAADPVTATRVSGVIENTAQEPLAGVIIELGSLQTVTAADGSFILETPGALPDNTLKIRGEGISGDVTYPFIAEKLPLLLEHEVYTGVNNVISRPIYLPPIDTANAETIEPAADVTVTTSNIPGASVFVAAGSLKDQQGNPYTGQLSITEVPAELTPAALPSNLHPDVVAANNVISFFGFNYDTASRITQIADLDGTADYTYDDRDQLTGANHSNSNNPDESYSYDGNGNRVSSSVNGSGYVTGVNNRLQKDGIYNYQYDDEGNLIRRTEIATGKVREFEWDYRNRLVGVVDKDAANAVIQQVAFTYDAMDRRIAKSVNGAVTHFVYDGDNVLLDFVDSDGTAGPNQPVLDRRYLHGPVVDQVLAQDSGAGNVVWHLADHLGTVRDLANSSGAVVSHLTYDSFGNVIAQTNGTIMTRYLFTGREFDEETGLHYYRARYYNGTVGRFLSEDPIGFAGGDANLYRYVGNSPLNATDPTGLQLLFSPGPILGPGLRQILPLFPGAEEYNNINQPSNWHPRFGDCTKNDWYVLQREVSDKCKGPNSARRCVDGMSTAEALANKAKFEACAEARRIINETCYRGGDPAHLEAIEQALNGAQKCEQIANACTP